MRPYRQFLRRLVTYAERHAPERFSAAELLRCLHEGVKTSSEARRLVRASRIEFLEDDSELSTPECAYFLCRSRHFVGTLIRSGLLPAEPRWKADGSWAYRVDGKALRRFANGLDD